MYKLKEIKHAQMFLLEKENDCWENKEILDYYFSHGENCLIAVRVFG